MKTGTSESGGNPSTARGQGKLDRGADVSSCQAGARAHDRGHGAAALLDHSAASVVPHRVPNVPYCATQVRPAVRLGLMCRLRVLPLLSPPEELRGKQADEAEH